MMKVCSQTWAILGHYTRWSLYFRRKESIRDRQRWATGADAGHGCDESRALHRVSERISAPSTALLFGRLLPTRTSQDPRPLPRGPLSRASTAINDIRTSSAARLDADNSANSSRIAPIALVEITRRTARCDRVQHRGPNGSCRSGSVEAGAYGRAHCNGGREYGASLRYSVQYV